MWDNSFGSFYVVYAVLGLLGLMFFGAILAISAGIARLFGVKDRGVWFTGLIAAVSGTVIGVGIDWSYGVLLAIPMSAGFALASGLVSWTGYFRRPGKYER